jgi:hypothetical protein
MPAMTEIGNTCRIGRIIELKAHLWLNRRGYEVFDNVFHEGPIDAVAVNTSSKQIILLEIRKARLTPTGYDYGKLTKFQETLGIKLLIYKPELDEFELDPAPRKKRSELAWPEIGKRSAATRMRNLQLKVVGDV